MIAPNSCARNGAKKRGEVEGEYGRMMIIIAPNSRVRKAGKKRGEVEGEYG